jgi:hypothetical protein
MVMKLTYDRADILKWGHTGSALGDEQISSAVNYLIG